MPDTVALIIWVIAGVAGGNAAGELLKGDYDFRPGKLGGWSNRRGRRSGNPAIPALSFERLRYRSPHRTDGRSRHQWGGPDSRRRHCEDSPPAPISTRAAASSDVIPGLGACAT